MVNRNRSFRDGSVHQNWNPRWVSSDGPALALVGQQAPARTEGGKSGGTNLEFRLPYSSNNIQDCNRHFALHHTRHSGASIGCAVSEACKKCKDEVSGRRSAVSQGTTKAVVGLAPAPAPRQAGITRATCRGDADKATASPAVRKRTTGKSMLDVFGVSGFLTKATNQWDNFTSTTTHFLLSQDLFRQCWQRNFASSCSHALDSGTPM